MRQAAVGIRVVLFVLGAWGSVGGGGVLVYFVTREPFEIHLAVNDGDASAGLAFDVRNSVLVGSVQTGIDVMIAGWALLAIAALLPRSNSATASRGRPARLGRGRPAVVSLRRRGLGSAPAASET